MTNKDISVPRDETDAAFEALESLFFKPRKGRFATTTDADAFDAASDTIKDEMKRLQEERDAALKLVDDTLEALGAETT